MIEFKPQLVQIYQCSLSLRTDKTRVQATCRQGCSDWAFSGEMFSKCCNSIYWLLYDAYLQHILKYTTVITVLRLKALFFLNGSGNPRHGLPFWSGPRNSDLPKLKLCTIPIPVARLQVRVREYTSSSIQNPIILSTKLHNLRPVPGDSCRAPACFRWDFSTFTLLLLTLEVPLRGKGVCPVLKIEPEELREWRI